MISLYLWIKALHLISMVAWFAGLFYLPRLFVYHMTVPAGGEASETFKTMEQKLLKIIMTPAMVATWIFGLTMIALNTSLLSDGWLHAKLLLLIGLSGFHGFLSASRRKFEADARPRTEKFWRLMNEAPTIGLVLIIFLAILKPF